MQPVQNSLAARPSPTVRHKRNRSKVTNGKRMFVVGHGWSPWARRWRDLIEIHSNDLSAGDPSILSEAQRSLIKRAATLEIELEQVEGRLSMGKAQDLATYATAASHLRRIFETLGLDRKARDVTGQTIEGSAISEWPTSPMRNRLTTATP
jgi:hypothetical protein